MALDEAALETLGLGTLWVRRGASNGHGADAQESVASELVEVEAVRATAAPVRESAAREDKPEPDRAAALRPGRQAAGGVQAPRAAEADAAFAVERPSAPTAAPVQAPPTMPGRTPSSRAAAEPTLDEPAWDDFEPVPPALPEFADAAPAGDERNAGGVAMLDWDALEARVSACERCRLCEKRTNTVFGVGDRAADWMLIGEAPGENEDKQGEPFVGQAGKLLDSMLRALSLARGDNVYIANVVKCRPPGNRNPEPDEVARCEPYLQRQVALVKPKLIIALGRVAAQNLLKTDASISSLRGRVHRYEDVPVIVTYHPAYLLRSLPDKAKAWVDLCLAHDTYRQALAEEQAPR